MRVVPLLITAFLFFSTLDSWAGYWLAGRFFISSRYATVSLATVKSWLDRGIVSSLTQQVKILIRKYGKWILLTLGLSEVIREVQSLQSSTQSTQYCYLTTSSDWVSCHIDRKAVVCSGYSQTRNYYTASSNDLEKCLGISGSVRAALVYVWNGRLNRWERTSYSVPLPGSHFVGRNINGFQCYIDVSVNIAPCPFTNTDHYVPGNPPNVNLQEKRRVPVRVFPRVEDFIRSDVVANDPALRFLRDEFHRIASDSSIPTIPADALGDLELPEISWNIPSDEAIDYASEQGSTSQPSDRSSDTPSDISIPGLDTSLPTIQKKTFPIELINTLVQNHPLLRILQGINFDAGGFGSCVIGSGTFTISFCEYAWILNLMGAIIVPIAFLVGLFGWRD